MQWEGDEQSADERRRLRNALVTSAVCHVLVVAMLALSPRSAPSPGLTAITVDLVASVPGAPRPSAPKAAPRPAPAPPKPAPVVAPPPPKPQAKILPKHAPDPVAKPRAKPEPERKPRPKELSYDDALAKLRDDLGEPETAPDTTSDEASDAPSDADLLALARPGAGVQVSPEEAAWILATRRHIRAIWITPADFLNRGLSTELRVQLSAAGEVLGTPQVVRSSGDPFADDNAVRALLKASPLPAPPQAGSRTFIFEPEERS